MFKSKITRIISMASAAACMTACLNFAPADISEAVEVKTAFEITEDMGLGWNLGNSFDAYNGNLDKMGLESETVWGNPKTSNEMLDAVKAKGFNTIRVPVTWYQHVDENYTIDAEWLARVKEVVDHCYSNGMYVIINLHHEEPYQNRATLGADYEEISKFVTTIWGQLAETFKDYDQHIIFETMNEPRATGTDHEWWGPTDAEVDTINKINADALDVIRKAGGQNETRLVMMPGYCASSDTSMMSKVIIPDDDFVAASVHAYSPYSFAMDEKSDHSVFTDAHKNELINIMDGIRKTFSDKDIPVVLGEFSASDYDNTEARCEWAEVYLSTTKAYGFPCVLWDNNSIGGSNKAENHGYLKRNDCTWYKNSELVIDTMLKVLDDSSIVWGSERKSPVISHDDITSGKQLINKTYDLDASVEDGNCTEGLNVTWKDLEGGDVAIKYTGEAPVIAVVDGAWDNWTEIKPYDDADGIAYYSAEHIKSAWESKGLDVNDIEHLFARTNGKTTVTAIAIIGAADVVTDPEPEVPIYTADLTKTDRKTLTFVITGKAGSTVNGCVGYMDGEWTQIEWADKIGADGTVTITVDISDIPASISSAQVQIWWCDDKEAEVTIKYDGETPAATTTAPAGTTPPTTTEAVPTEFKCGDANCDGIVDIADATSIIQHIGNEGKYALSEQGFANADTNGDGVVTGADALIIQRIEAGEYSISDLPVKAS